VGVIIFVVILSGKADYDCCTTVSSIGVFLCHTEQSKTTKKTLKRNKLILYFYKCLRSQKCFKIKKNNTKEIRMLNIASGMKKNLSNLLTLSVPDDVPDEQHALKG
jgi:hypothetical protein